MASVVTMPRHRTVLHALLGYREPGAGDGRAVFDAGASVEEISYRALATMSCRAADTLTQHGVRQGDRVILCLPASPAFCTGFFGTQSLGAVPAPIRPPAEEDVVSDEFVRLLRYLEPSAIIATSEVTAALHGLRDVFAELPRGMALIDGTVLHRRARRPDVPVLAPLLPLPGEPALLRCGMNPKGFPRGVLVSHAQLAASCEQLARASACGPGETWAGWLPPHLGMGLLGGLLVPMFTGADTVVLPPNLFRRRPAAWLRAVHRYRGTVTAAPHFAFGYTVARVGDRELDGVDLSCLRFLLCGAGPVHLETLRGFGDRFARWGMRPDATVPYYEPAEGAFAVTVAGPGGPPTFDTVSHQRLVGSGHVVDVAADASDARPVADCGAPLPGTEVRVVGRSGRPLPEDRLGRVQVRGPARTMGYFRLPQVTAETIDHDGWWDTGDLGYLRGGHLRIIDKASTPNHFAAEARVRTTIGTRVGSAFTTGPWGRIRLVARR